MSLYLNWIHVLLELIIEQKEIKEFVLSESVRGMAKW
jgi:hypothetical protein